MLDSFIALLTRAVPGLLATLLGALIIVGLVGFARSVGFMVGLAPDSSIKMRRIRVLGDLLSTGGLIALALRDVVHDGTVDLEQISGINLHLQPPWSLGVPAILAIVWVRATVHNYRHARRQHARPDRQSITIYRSLFNPDSLFTEKRKLDAWLVSETRVLRDLIVDVFAGRMRGLLTAQRDVLAPLTAGAAGTRGPGPGAEHPRAADTRAGGFPIGAVCLLWVWALWRLPTLLGLSFWQALEIQTAGPYLPAAVSDLLPHQVLVAGPSIETLDLALLGAVITVTIVRQGSLLIRLALRAIALACLASTVFVVLTRASMPLWSLVLSLPVIGTLMMLSGSARYDAPRGWWGSGGSYVANVRRPVVRTIVAAVIMTVTACWWAGTSYAGLVGGAETTRESYFQALRVLGGYAGWVLAYVLVVHFVFLLLTNLSVAPLARRMVGAATIWASVLGFLALSILMPALIRTDGGVAIAYLSDVGWSASYLAPAPPSWLAGPILATTAFTWATIGLLRGPLGQFRIEVPQPVSAVGAAD